MIPRLCYGEERWVTRDPGSVFCRTALWEFFGLASDFLNDYHKVLWETGSKTPTQSPTKASSNSSQYCLSNQEFGREIYAVTIQTRPLGRFFYTRVICFTIFYKIFANFHFERIQRVSFCYYWRSDSKAHVHRKNFCLAVNKALYKRVYLLLG